jgi:hypothetical protein
MTEKDFDEAYAKTESGDFYAISISDEGSLKEEFGQLAGVLIQFGTGDKAHMGYLRDKATNKGVESVDKGTIVTNPISLYRGKRSVGITWYRLKDLTADKLALMNTECDKIVSEKHAYAWGNIGQLSFRALLCKIPFIGFALNEFIWKIPYFDNTKDLFCSEVTTMIAKKADPTFRKDYQPNQVTPTRFCQSSRLMIVSEAVGGNA